MTLFQCKSIGCSSTVTNADFCSPCLNKATDDLDSSLHALSDKYPDTYRDVGELEQIDIHAVHHLFEIQDHSGCLQQASSKILMTGTSQNIFTDVREARDLLTRWLQLNQESKVT